MKNKHQFALICIALLVVWFGGLPWVFGIAGAFASIIIPLVVVALVLLFAMFSSAFDHWKS